MRIVSLLAICHSQHKPVGRVNNSRSSLSAKSHDPGFAEVGVVAVITTVL